jgi:NADH-quinone oxidoreductase subunit N
METVLHELSQVSHLVALACGALLVMMVDAFDSGKEKRLLIPELITGLTFVVSGYYLYDIWGISSSQPLLGGAILGDAFAQCIALLVIAGGSITYLMSLGTTQREGIDAAGAFYSLMLFACTGGILFASAADYITMFLGLEILSMAVYVLCGSSVALKGSASKRSAEASLKYFLLGAFSSAFFLYGVALLYGLTGTFSLAEIGARIGTVDPTIVFLALGLLLVGLCFKIGIVPFHFWVPDAYQGAPTIVTAFMSSVIKVVAVAGALRVLWISFRAEVVFWSGVVWLLAVMTIVLGNLVALRQRSVKRMLAYSSIAQAGYILTGFLSIGGTLGGGNAILYYLAIYSLVSLGSFGVVAAVTGNTTASQHPDDLSRFNALGKRRPVLAASMTLFLLTLAGLPPGIAGLVGKLYLFSAAVQADYIGLVIIAVLGSAVSCYYYLRIVVAMYFVEHDAERERIDEIGLPMVAGLTLCVIGTLWLGVFPDGIYAVAVQAIQGLRG